MRKEELILLFLGKNCKKYTKKQVEKYVGDNIDNELRQLEVEGKIYIDSNGYISSFPPHLEIGRIIIQNNRPILIKDGKHYIIRREDLNTARHNDLVIIKKSENVIPRNKKNYKVAKVEKVLRRATNNIIVEVREKDGKLYLEPINIPLDGPIIISNNKLKEYSIGDRLLVETSEPDSKRNYQASVIDFIAHKDDPNIEINTLLIKNGFTKKLSEESQKELDQIPDEVRPMDYKGRKDLRKILTISIDGKTAKDRDDAISLLKLPNGNYLFMGHISAVSYYIHPGMHLWDEVMYRGSSVYPLNLVNHMIDERIATGICSLNEKVDRLTETTFIEIDPLGNIVNYYTDSTVINSHKACTYEDVNKILEENTMVAGYEDLEDTLREMEHVMYLIRDKMLKRGLLEFNVGDTVVERDASGKIHKIFQKKMGTAEKIIEFFMLIIDMVNAESAMLPMIYRVHEAPDITALEQTLAILRRTVKSIKIPKRITCAKQIQNILEQVRGKPEEEYVTRMLIQGMKRAGFSEDNIGHFALATEGDIQITSPMRRAGDLHNQYYKIQERKGVRYTNRQLAELYRKAHELARRLNQVELAAERVEYEAKEIGMRDYLRQQKIAAQNATITYLSRKLVLVRSDDGVEGQLDLNGAYYYDRETNSLRHRRNNFRLQVGNAVAIVPKSQENGLTFALKK